MERILDVPARAVHGGENLGVLQRQRHGDSPGMSLLGEPELPNKRLQGGPARAPSEPLWDYWLLQHLRGNPAYGLRYGRITLSHR